MDTPRNFSLQLGTLIAMYASVTALITLLFGIITIAFPDPADTYWEFENAQTSARIGIAMLVVFFPTYLVLTRVVNKIRRKGEGGTYLLLTKWLIYLSLVVGGGILLGDLVTVIVSFLEGDMTVRFMLKALTILVVVGAAFYYYLQDARGVWLTHEKQSIRFGVAVSVLVVAVVIVGFYKIESPFTAHEREIDDRQINDLQQIQNQLEDYYYRTNRLPMSLGEMSTPTPLPTAPNTRPPYSYNSYEGGFELCATFAYASRDGYDTFARPVMDADVLIKNAYNWDHPAGYFCFQRTVSENVPTVDAEG